MKANYVNVSCLGLSVCKMGILTAASIVRNVNSVQQPLSSTSLAQCKDAVLFLNGCILCGRYRDMDSCSIQR